MKEEYVRTVTLRDVPKKAGWAMRSLRSEVFIEMADVMTMVFRMVVCGKPFRAKSRTNGEGFQIVIIQDKNEHYEDATTFHVAGWQLQRINFAIEAIKKYPAPRDRVKILMMLRRCESLKWSMLDPSLKLSLKDLIEAQAS